MKEVMNVEIKKITLGGFRNITKIELSMDNIIALVGLNGYGKSNVMDAIDFGFDFLHFPAAGKTTLMSSKHCIPLLKANAGNDFQFEIEFKLTSHKSDYFVVYSYSFAWETEAHSAKILHETLRIKKDDKNQKYNTYISRNGFEARYKPSATGRCDKRIKIEDNGLVINKLLAIDDLYYLDIIQQINNVQFYIERHLDASQSFVPSPFLIRGFQELELQGISSVPRAIFFLKKDYPDKYELLVNAFTQLFPNIIDINVQEIELNSSIQDASLKLSEDAPIIFSDCIYAMSIMDEKLLQPVGFERLSDGTKRVFLMLTFAVIADIKNLSMFAIEEPENSIHPALFQNYLDVLSQLVQGCKIIITSHSPYVIQYLQPHNIYIGMSSNTGEVDFKRIAPTKVNSLFRDAVEYDRSVGDYIFNLISSSDSDEYLREYLEGVN
ncbi:MAG: AAA family ATPase [Clostridia bacterium]|nr:AAA family ATPase [Clostridia bacterium]